MVQGGFEPPRGKLSGRVSLCGVGFCGRALRAYTNGEWARRAMTAVAIFVKSFWFQLSTNCIVNNNLLLNI